MTRCISGFAVTESFSKDMGQTFCLITPIVKSCRLCRPPSLSSFIRKQSSTEIHMPNKYSPWARPQGPLSKDWENPAWRRVGSLRPTQTSPVHIEHIWRFPETRVPPNHPCIDDFCIINHPFGGTHIYGNPIVCMWSDSDWGPFIVSPWSHNTQITPSWSCPEKTSAVEDRQIDALKTTCNHVEELKRQEILSHLWHAESSHLGDSSLKAAELLKKIFRPVDWLIGIPITDNWWYLWGCKCL